MSHLKPYQPQSKTFEDECSGVQSIEQSSDMWTFKESDCKKSDSMNNQVQSHSRQKRDMKPLVKLDLWNIMQLFDNKLYLSCYKWIAYKWLPNRE